MSTTIDSRVVEMKFDNSHFERNVSTTMSTLDKLKQKLNLSGASKGLEDINAASKQTNIPILGNAVEAVSTKFSALQVMGVTALANITNSAVNAGKRIASALTIDPIKTGFQEYETQINAVQTILANTSSKGTTLQQVNSALDTLNKYADKTIYNFTEMTRNIGTFTAAGVDLETSVSAIQGIANLAAVSGSTSQQASTAMYQLSQALSSGTVKLMDWNSVVNAGMGGQVFQDALKQTARVHGIAIDKMIEDEGSFRETLSKGWLTADILTETLNQFTMAAEEGTDEWEAYKKSLMDTGYTEEQAIAILKMANTATDAATKVKTFTQLWDTLKESAQSGWTESWEIMVGDFEEAKGFLTEVSDRLGSMIGESAEARNAMLSGGLSSGWKQLLNAGIADEAGYKDTFKSVAKEHGTSIDDMIAAEKKLDDSLTDTEAFQKALKTGFKDGSITADMLTESVHKMTDKMSNMSAEELKAAGYTQDHVKQIKELSAGLKDGSISMDDFVNKMTRPSGRENIIQALWNSFDGLISVIEPIKEAFREIFPPMTGEQIYKLTEQIRDLTAKFKLSEDQADKLKSVFKGVFSVFDIGLSAVKLLTKGIVEVLRKINGFSGGLLDGAASFGDFLTNLRDSVKETDFFGNVINKVVSFLSNAIDKIKEFGQSLKNGFENSNSNSIFGFFKGLWDIITKISAGIAKVFSKIASTISEIFGKGDILEVLNSGVLISILVGVKKMTSSLSDTFENVGGFVKNVKSILDDVRGCLQAYQEQLKAGTLLKIASAIAILAGSLFVISTIDSDKLGTAVIAIGVLFGMLVGAMALMNKIETSGKKPLDKTVNSLSSACRTLSMIGLAIAVTILAGAMKILAGIDCEGISKSIDGLTAIVIILVTAAKIMDSEDRAITKFAGQMFLMSIAIGALSLVAKMLSSMSLEGTANGLIALAGAFVIIGVAGLLLKPLIVPILGLAGAFALLGVGMAGIGAGLLLVSAGIAALGASLAAGATAIVAGLTVIVTDILELIPTIARIIGEGIVEIAKVIGEYAPQLAESCLLLIEGVLEALAEHAPAITNALLDFLIGVINSLADHMPTLIEALVNLLSKLFEGVAAALKDLDPGVLRNAIAAAIGLSALLLAISVALKNLGSISIGNALKGAIALTVMAVPLVAFVGVLALMSNIDNAMNNALALVVLTGSLTIMLGVLTIIGAAWPAAAAGLIALIAMTIPLLAFVGILALMNCVDNAMSNALLLGAFMSILADVLVKISLVAPLAIIGVAAMSGLAALMGVIGTFAVAVGALMDKFPSLQKFLDSGLPVLEQLAGSIGTMIGNFIGGIGEGLGDSLVKMGENISEFMGKLAEASDKASGIKGESFDGVKQLMGVMGDIALTTVGTSIGDIFTLGGTSMEKFEKDGVVFFNAMKAIGEASSDIDINERSMNSVIGVAKNLAELQSSLEPIGGVVTWFTGRDDLGTFGENAALFVSSMNTAFGSLDDTSLNTEAMDSIIASATSLAKLQSSLEPIGGVVTWFSGKDDLGAFGENIAQFITSISAAMSSPNGTEFNTEAMDQIITAATSLAKLQSSLEPIGGVITWFTGRDDLGIFGHSVAAFIDSIVTALSKLNGTTLDSDALGSVVTAATELAKIQSSLEPMGGVVSWFTGRDDLGTFGTNLGLFADAMAKLKQGMGENGITEATITSITNTGTALIELQKALPEEHWFDGKMNLSDFSKRIDDFATAMGTFGSKASEIDPSAVSTVISTAYRIKYLIESLADLDTSGLQTFTGIGTGGFGADGAAYEIAQTIAEFSNKVAGINTEAVSVSVWAAQRLKTLINSLTSLDTSGIENFKPQTIGSVMKGYADKVAGIDTGVVSSSITSANRLKNFIASLSGLDTSGIGNFKVGSIGSSLQTYSNSISNVNIGAITSSIIATNKLKNLIASLSGLDTSGVSSFKSAINDLSGANVSAFVKAFSGASSKLTLVGADMITGLIKGMQSKLPAITSCLSSAVTNIRTYYASFYSAGSYLADGLANGISANAYKATAKAKAMAEAAVKAVREALKINSPSKVFREIGSGIPEGFAMGISMLSGDVKDSVTNMTSTAVKATKSTMSTVLDALSADIDAQPTIRPVIDLTDVQTGANALNGMFNGVQTIGVRSNLNAINSAINAKLQNGSNDDVISAIDKLRGSLETNRGDVYNFGDFTYDDGDNISDAVRTLVRAAKMGRRV